LVVAIGATLNAAILAWDRPQSWIADDRLIGAPLHFMQGGSDQKWIAAIDETLNAQAA